MFLVTTSDRDAWPEKEKFWILTEGCRYSADDQNQFQDQILGVIPDPFANGTLNRDFYSNISSLGEEFIKILVPRLNQIHKVNHSEKYWQVLLGYWTLFYASVVFDRFHHLTTAKNKFDEIVVCGCKNNQINVPNDNLDFVYIVRTDRFNTNLYTQIAQFLNYKINLRVANNLGKELEITETLQLHKSNKLKRALLKFSEFLDKLLRVIYVKYPNVVLEDSYLPKWMTYLLTLISRGRIVDSRNNSNGDTIVNTDVDISKREILSQSLSEEKTVMELMFKLLPSYFPKSFLEDFGLIHSISENRYAKLKVPDLIFSVTAWAFNEPFKFWAANSQERGSKLAGGEHGGAPFLAKYKMLFDFETLYTDLYFTWGWSNLERNDIIPTPANKLIRFGGKKSKVLKEDILYVATAEPKYNLACLEDFSRYLEWQRIFFKNSSIQLQHHLKVRIHYHDFGWNIKGRIEAVAAKVSFDTWEKSFQSRLKSGMIKLCVVDYLSTTFAESMSFNVPTVLYFDTDVYPLEPEMKEDFETLEKVKIFHRSPESALQWIESIRDNPDAWFSEPECQSAVKNFTQKYARPSIRPTLEWKKILLESVNNK